MEIVELSSSRSRSSSSSSSKNCITLSNRTLYPKVAELLFEVFSIFIR